MENVITDTDAHTATKTDTKMVTIHSSNNSHSEIPMTCSESSLAHLPLIVFLKVIVSICYFGSCCLDVLTENFFPTDFNSTVPATRGSQQYISIPMFQPFGNFDAFFSDSFSSSNMAMNGNGHGGAAVKRTSTSTTFANGKKITTKR